MDNWTRFAQGRASSAEQAGSTKLDCVAGTIQRINYQRGEMTVIASGRVLQFRVATDCRLSFNDAPALLRCFHPLDPVTVHFDGDVVQALHCWDPHCLPASGLAAAG